MTIYADRETGACDLFRRCCINRRATINKKETAVPEIKIRKQKKDLRVGDQQMFKKIKRKKYWRSYAHRNNKACDLFKMCVDPEPRLAKRQVMSKMESEIKFNERRRSLRSEKASRIKYY